VRPLLEKFAVYDNVTFAFILRNPLEHPALDRKLLVELVKHYGAKPEAAEHIANLIKSLSSDVSEFTAALRDIRNQIDNGKIAVANYEELQKIFQREKLHMLLIGNSKLTHV
jgi:hypothetical protein